MQTTTEPSTPPTRPELLELASPGAIQPRPRRYVGDTVVASIDQIDAGDAAVVRRLYAFLTDVYARVQRLDAPADGLPALQDELTRHDYRGLCEQIHGLGAALAAEDTPLDLRKVYHDVRGGSLNGLLMHLDMIAMGDGEVEDVERVFILVRDHLKIMRNALPDLDPEGYAADLAPIEHDAGLLVQKWADTRYGTESAAPVRVRLVCEFTGGVSQCCMEFAALDRVIYNLINNAARFAADAEVHLELFPLGPERETDLRFAVSNLVASEHRERLRSDLGDDLSEIFAGDYTTGGHGVGLQICSDIVSHGYGLGSTREALRGGYLGARLVRDYFVAWFHWPARRSA